MPKIQLSIPDLKAQVLALRQMAQDPMAAPVNSELHAEAELRRLEVGPRADGLELDRVRIDDADGGANTYFAFSPNRWRAPSLRLSEDSGFRTQRRVRRRCVE